MLLGIETVIGEIALKEKRAEPIYLEGHSGASRSGKPPKHKRLGMNRRKMQQAQLIAKHPDIVEKVKAIAKENDDIATKTAVLSEIKRKR